MYAVVSDIVAKIGEDALISISDHNNDGEMDADVVAGAIQDAGAEIDGAVGHRYKLPMNPVPRRLLTIAVDLAIHHMDRNPTDDLARRVKDARAALAAIRDGKESLIDSEQIGDEPKGGGAGDDLPAVAQFTTSMDMGGYS